MVIKIKIIPSSRTEWLGWFGNETVKVRIKTKKENDIEGFLHLLESDLGIKRQCIRVINCSNNFAQIELPDVAWELLLNVVQ